MTLLSTLLSTLLLAPLPCSAILPLASAADAGHDRYRLEVLVAEQEVRVVADLDYRGGEQAEAEVVFYLGKDLLLSRVECAGLEEYTFASDGSFLSDLAHALTLRLAAPLPPGAALPIHLEYAGPLKTAFAEDWVEFFADAAFAPLHQALLRRVTWECAVTFDDPRYLVFGPGEVCGGEGRWTLRSAIPGGDVAFVAGPELTVAERAREPYAVQIAHRGVSEAALDRLADEALWILEFYNETFGVDEPRHRCKFVVRPTERNLGYARPGYIVLAREALARRSPMSGSQSTGHFSFMAHEIAHLWWSRGDPGGFENWLNESFAEYSSMLALRERFGVEDYDADVAAKQMLAADLPPVLAIERTDPRSHAVFYKKGPLLLHRLRKQLGEGEFCELLVAVLSERIATTEHLVTLLEELHGEEVAAGFRAELGR